MADSQMAFLPLVRKWVDLAPLHLPFHVAAVVLVSLTLLLAWLPEVPLVR